MVKSKLLKVKKWVDLNEAASRLSIALNEPVNALDLLELALDGELVLSVKFPFDKKYVAKKMWEIHTPMGERMRKLFSFSCFFSGKDENDVNYIEKENEYLIAKHKEFLEKSHGCELSEEQKTFDYYCNSVQMVEWKYGEIDYLEEQIYELSMLGSESIDIMWLIQANKNKEMDELTNLDGVILRDNDGILYNLQEKFDEKYINKNRDDEALDPLDKLNKIFKLNGSHYFPAGGLPSGCEIGMSPANMSKFEARLSEDESAFSESQLLTVIGAVLKEITTSEARKWTQGDLASRIDDKKMANLSERVINGVFANANKHLKSIN
ncbi:hypothetical protein EKN56_19835 [Limnobaculum zhutongyuii]|uniref:Uncharacterized protein n=1 Tax=Limnobaculum zhutongyuii TaxID=2498113 RepID=A0A411WQA5_9GAMM|nr:hypothetical protein [Limnobaculum zhutongyuii]QBH98443.1 hypothetical protein EKN56_19835 [Limnobaculum zhutongyuii]TQS89659.1 hypothetical protein ELQ32_04405 [Limnobaculum zhutongyuii]